MTNTRLFRYSFVVTRPNATNNRYSFALAPPNTIHIRYSFAMTLPSVSPWFGVANYDKATESL